MDLNALDAFSREFAELLFLSHPDWIARATNERKAGEEQGHLFVVVPAEPQADLSESLRISTDDKEVTVGIGDYHRHFNEGALGIDPTDLHGVYRAALDFVQGIVAEEIAIVSIWKNGRNAGAWCKSKAGALSMTADNPGDGDLGSSIWQPLPNDPGTDTLVRIRSWRGSLNRDLRPAPALDNGTAKRSPNVNKI
jgi:hypothetical protein